MITTAIIGCGYWGLNIVRTLYENPNCILKYCCDIDEKKLANILSQYPEVRITRYSEEVFNDKGVQAVFIATPLSWHYPLAKEGLLAKKAIFVEKPFVMNVEQGKKLVKLSEQNKVPLAVGHIFEYAPPVIKIKELLDKDEIGDIYYISSTRVNLGIHRKDGSVVWDLASHDLSMIFYWLEEEPISIQVTGKESIIKGKPDIAFLTLRFPSDILVNIQVSWLAPSKLRNTVIVGSKKMIIYDDTNQLEKVKIFDKGISKLEHSSFGEFQLSYRTGDITVPVLSNAEPLRQEINHFLKCVEFNQTPKTDGNSGIRVVKYLELAEQSLKSNGKTITVNSKNKCLPA
ncbi:Gfo/Idh/MocA family oxidoreductase [candidate division WOR-3 bacterium]|nr:Gfo/Idh/MocA family oxidoreductase [candidate division WOR-3 bacterium]